MKQQDAIAVVKEQLLPAFQSERHELLKIDQYLRNEQPTAKLPRRASREHKYLAEIARTPWLRLVVNSAVQMLHAEAVYSTERDVRQMWAPFTRNGMVAKQTPLYRDAIGFGTAYVTALPGQFREQKNVAKLRPYSPLEMFAVYADPAEDEWPMFAVRVIPQPRDTFHYRLLDEESVYYLSDGPDGVQYLERREHGLGVCPVIRYSPRLDLMGRADGDVGPFRTTADRLDKTEYDRLLAQHYNSWRVKTATKLDDNISDEESEKIRMQLSHEDILLGSNETEFSTLDQTSLSDFDQAKESHVETLAAISQTPTTALSGKMINVSADGLAEAKANAYAKRNEFQVTLGGSHIQTLRLAAQIENRPEDAADYTATISWDDTETRTLNQAVDALGKAATMLGVPPELLWEFIPGVSKTKSDYWKKYAQEHPQDALDPYGRHDVPTLD